MSARANAPRPSHTQPAHNAPARPRFGLVGPAAKLDPRINPVRNDLADIALAGKVFAPHYAQAVDFACALPFVTVHLRPHREGEGVTQLLRGERFHILDVTGDWAWGYCDHDAYVGYVERVALDSPEPTDHIVIAPQAPLFARPDIKSPILDYWPIGARFQGKAEGAFLEAGGFYLHYHHAEALDAGAVDWLSVAQSYLGLPYVWGGRGGGGVDCSGLLQMALARCGIPIPRDTDLQRAVLGQEVPEGEPLKRGDILFFPGHVGLMVDKETLLHANAHWMSVVTEPLTDVIARLRPTYENPILARRRIVP